MDVAHFGRLTRVALRAAPWLGWAIVIWIVVFWRLGYPSFWDPGDEAHYAEATREMLASGHWLVPMYNGQPFFDKPVLFYVLQMAAFAAFGPTEFAARLVPAVSTLGLLAAVWWLGRRLFDAEVASLGTLMLSLLPATFALSAYAILDMTFTAFLFAGLAMIAVAALRDRPRLQYPGYVLLALAVLTKGPLAIVLAGLTFGVVLLVAPAARRPLLALRWRTGLVLVIAIAAPWFLGMWWHFGSAFIDGYLLRENVWLYARPLFGPSTKSWTFYFRVVGLGLLPWTPVLAGRVVDILRGDRCTTEERVLWAWAVTVTGFFTFSHFKLDHYVYPVAPALCLLTAHGWQRLRATDHMRGQAGTAAGALLAAAVLIAAGVALFPIANRVPIDVTRWARVVPAALFAAGVTSLVRLGLGRLRPPRVPLGVAAGLLTVYAVVILAALPFVERAKPVKDLAQWVGANIPVTGVVGAYRMDRWNTSWRFYVERPVAQIDTPDQFGEFLRQPGRHVCVMLRSDFDELVAAGYSLHVEQERIGLFTTTGRVLLGGRRANWQTFLVVADVPM
jgi:4-amino-4-deoxy-L-arabinose transferase-like glycosyltransferase